MGIEYMSFSLSMLYGYLQLPWWGYVLVALALTHVTIVTVTLFLHRCQAHRALDMHPLVQHFFRFWLWLTTGMVTKEWVAIHRKHHAKCETPEDPHSPHVYGIGKVMLEGAELYRAESLRPETMEAYGHGTPDDWLERHLYSRHNFMGVTLMAFIDAALFGVYGIVIWAVQMLWIPFWAAGVINGLGHYRGYRNYETTDGSTNVSPIGIIVGGEEMHNNHHAFPSSAKFSMRRWEFDIGWMYIRLLQAFGLALVKKVAPRPVIVADKDKLDAETARAVVVGRLHLMANYARQVMLPVLREELHKADDSCRRLLKRGRRALVREESRMDERTRARLADALESCESLNTVYQFRLRLQALWSRTQATDKLLGSLQEWCTQAEASGIRALQDFARELRGYSLGKTVVSGRV
ncbi:Fatty acid desaturase [Acidihalobacter prosperus]|uniref:Fatty acid desaturase n=2 Tax=Acidihalobacter prosperus TaxID=160660 RepID=A0A1A6C540_9GAMM|nr:Fatty acid desaturase [Acidihalobacter prosperus]